MALFQFVSCISYRNILFGRIVSDSLYFSCTLERKINLTVTLNTISKLDSDCDNEYIEKLFIGLLNSQRGSLASAITLVESQNLKKRLNAQLLLTKVLKHNKCKYSKSGHEALSFRIGLTGSPGVGKSTFVEAFGKMLTGMGKKVSVLTVDPSSSTTGGSLLGDKTRMPELSRDPCAYIRPSPTSGCLGGVTRSTNETIVLCEAAGYDVIIVETVGVGQSEIDVASMVDMFVLLVAPGGGDELQGLKKGVMELVDMITINKSDGNLLPDSLRTQSEYLSALKFIRPHRKCWKPKVLQISSKSKTGIEDMWQKMCIFRKAMLQSGEYDAQRQSQYSFWMWSNLQNQLLSILKNDRKVQSLIKDIENDVKNGNMTPGQASDCLIKTFLQINEKHH